MKAYNGFAALLEVVKSLPRSEWLFVSKDASRDSKEGVRDAVYLIAENELEEIGLEKSHRTFLECPTLIDIVDVLNKRGTSPDMDGYIEAVLYYRENDDFLE